MEIKERNRIKKINKYLEGIYNLSPVTNKTQEPYFSSKPCECCSSTLGGNRYDFVGKLGKNHDADKIELSCCVDCYTYLFT